MLSQLPISSRFCPRCGAQTRIDAAADVEAIPLGASLVLKGYSNALYNLGRRYEAAIGAARNLREAERCYRKAARLGNFGALARLAAHWFA